MRNNDEIIALLIELKDRKGLSLSELARRVGMAKSALSRYFNKTRDFPLNKVNEFAAALDVTPEYILGFDEKNEETGDILDIYDALTENRKAKVYSFAKQQLEEQNKVVSMEEYKTIKIHSSLSAGTGIIDLDPEDTEEINYAGDVPEHDMAFRVSGDSMTPLFENGEIIFVKRTEDVRNGQVIAVQINEEAYIKKAYVENDCLRLVSLNKKYDDIIADGNDDIRIVGKVIL
jgi:phage repressor protein C with HTH and peptisase S24 domain